MAVDIFLKIDNLKGTGESKDKEHPGWIEIEVSGDIIKIEPPDSSPEASPEKSRILQHVSSSHQAGFSKVINELSASNEGKSGDVSTSKEGTDNTITIKKKLDQVSTELMGGAAIRKDYTGATLHFCTYKGEQTPYVEYKITKEFRIVSYSTDGIEDTCKFTLGDVQINKWGYSFSQQKVL